MLWNETVYVSLGSVFHIYNVYKFSFYTQVLKKKKKLPKSSRSWLVKGHAMV